MPLFLPKALLLAGFGFFSACSQKENVSAEISVQAQATALATANTQQGQVAIHDFKISIKEVEFEFDNDNADLASKPEIKDIKLKGPFELDLLHTNTALSVLLATVTLPNAAYEEVEFKMHKSTASGAMAGKSIVMTGAIGGQPFEFWHDTDEEFEIDFKNKSKDLLINGQDQQLKIAFDLNTLFDAVSGVDLSTAKDGNKNGIIEINPNDNDGNKELAKLIKDRLEEATDLLDD